MLHNQHPEVRKRLLQGKIGLEKESLRVTADGFFAQTPHPFPDSDLYIVRDFCENQAEINTAPGSSAAEAMEELAIQTQRINHALRRLPEPEYLWPFSNPPYIRNEADIPIAVFHGADAAKTEYRRYLADRYGRYKMTFSGIHFNYSFAEELLRAEYGAAGADPKETYRRFRDRFYIHLAARAQQYNWLVVAVTAASPLMDCSYFEKGHWGQDVFNGMASTRCSELGYWNAFTPVLDYTDIQSYVQSIRQYIGDGLIRSSSELYYPVRLKPPGVYSLDGLAAKGAGHMELRMIDLNPLSPWGIDRRDVRFLQLLLVWLACLPGDPASEMDAKGQIASIANTKNAARFDLKTVHLVGQAGSDGVPQSIADAATETIETMQRFYADFDGDIPQVLAFEKAKFLDMENRYAWQVRERFSGGFVEKGMQLAAAYTLQKNQQS